MASVSSAYNQNGGGYYMVLADLDKSVVGTAAAPDTSFINAYTPGSNSGGAATVGTFAVVNMSSIVGHNGGSTLVLANKLLKDMGKTVVSSGRTFRKFAPVSANTPSSFGVVGLAGNPGYASFYLEVGREGKGVPAPVVRYL